MIKLGAVRASPSYLSQRMRLSETAVRRLVAALWVIAVIAATIQQGVAHQNNNYLIFRAASLHLVHEQDLYAAYPALHFDFYKYSPSFALLFLPFALLPFIVSMLAWNALNAAVLYFGIGAVLPGRKATIARAVVFLDMLGSLQNVQSNALVTGLIIVTWAAYERRHMLAGSISALIGMAVKLFPLAAVSFAIFHPNKVRAGLGVAACLAAMLALPLLVTPWSTLMMQYASWHAIESADALERGFTVMQMVELALRQNWPNWPQQLLGTLALVAPVLVRRDQWGNWSFRVTYLCSLLVYCLIFNHQAESPTFVVGVAGAALWFAAHERWTRSTWALFAFFMIGTVLASSDAMPHAIQRAVFDPYKVKVVPLIVLWLIMQVELWRAHSRAVQQPSAIA
jgi:hypothetical protein